MGRFKLITIVVRSNKPFEALLNIYYFRFKLKIYLFILIKFAKTS